MLTSRSFDFLANHRLRAIPRTITLSQTTSSVSVLLFSRRQRAREGAQLAQEGQLLPIPQRTV